MFWYRVSQVPGEHHRRRCPTSPDLKVSVPWPIVCTRSKLRVPCLLEAVPPKDLATLLDDTTTVEETSFVQRTIVAH